MKHICFKYRPDFAFCIKGLKVMILNISYVIITDKLRDIILFESEFNFENKLYFWSRLLKIAES